MTSSRIVASSHSDRGHADHQIASDAAIQALRQTEIPAIAYSDLPYAIADPNLAPTRIRELEGRGLRIRDYVTSSTSSELKRSACVCYQSQMNLVGFEDCYSPHAERFYRVNIPRTTVVDDNG